VINFLRDFWKPLSDYKFRGYDFYGKELFAPLSWLFAILLVILLGK